MNKLRFALLITLMIVCPAAFTQAQLTYFLEHYTANDSCGGCQVGIVGGFIETDGTLGDVPEGDSPGQLRSVITNIEVTLDDGITQPGGEKTFAPYDPLVDLFSDGPAPRVVTFTETHVLLKESQTLKVFENSNLGSSSNLAFWVNQEGTGDPGRRVQLRGGVANVFGQVRFGPPEDLIIATVADAECNPTCSWITNGTGSWNAIDHWRINNVPGIPDSNAEGAILGGAISSSTTVVIDTDTVINSIQIDNGNSYVVAGSKTLSLEAGTPGNPSIDVVGQASPVTHEFQVRSTLNNATTVSVGSNATLEFNNRLDLGGNTLTKTGPGTISVNNVLNAGGGSLECNEGTCAGSGTVDGNLNNSGGTVSPGNSPGALVVEGDYIQAAHAALSIELGGTAPGGEHDVLIVNGTADLAGELEVTLLGDYQPGFSDSFDILEFGDTLGGFDSVSLPVLSNGLSWDMTALYANGSVSVVPEVSSWLLLLLGLVMSLARRK